MLSRFIGKWKTFLIFLLGGALAEIPFSFIVSSEIINYGGGASGGIFALIAAFLICYMRFPNEFNFKKFRLDLLIIIIYFIFANNDWFSFMTHAFGFTAGILITTIMIVLNLIKKDIRIKLKV